MRKRLWIVLLMVVLGAGLAYANRPVSAQTPDPTVSPPVSGSSDAGTMDVPSPNSVTPFTVSNPYCYQPDPSLDQCQINFRYMQATDNQSTPPYMTWLSITILNKNRFNATAFFEGTIYYSYDMVPDGFKVPCGAPNAGNAGDLYGAVYSVSITPLDSNRNTLLTDTANLTCPAYNP